MEYVSAYIRFPYGRTPEASGDRAHLYRPQGKALGEVYDLIMTLLQRGFSAQYPDLTLVAHDDGSVQVIQRDHATALSKEEFLALIELYVRTTGRTIVCTPGFEEPDLTELDVNAARLVRDLLSGNTDYTGFLPLAQQTFPVSLGI